MQIYWDDTELTPAHRNLVERALAATADFAALTDDSEVSIIFLSTEAMRKLNHTYRKIDSETDVLSFPGFEGSRALGDIVLCPEVAERQAREYVHTYERELAFLSVHGMLHLLGYEHETPDGEAEMCEAQNGIMRIIGVER
jgi:probable rRNA maturation factor